MKLSYKVQIIISIIIILAVNILTDLFDFWLYRSIGWVICGLLFVVNPAVPNGTEANKGRFSGHGWAAFC